MFINDVSHVFYWVHDVRDAYGHEFRDGREVRDGHEVRDVRDGHEVRDARKVRAILVVQSIHDANYAHDSFYVKNCYDSYNDDGDGYQKLHQPMQHQSMYQQDCLL